MSVLTRRPAESFALTAGLVAAAVCTLVGVTDPAKVSAVTVIVGVLPTLVTWLVVKLRGVES